MDFPIFHLDFVGNRLLIAVVAVLHVVVNHAMAVGAMPLVTTLEWWGVRTGDRRWDEIAYRVLKVCFIFATTIGALTGVGIWFAISLVNPYAIASLIRVFYWAWFTEWLVFITEVCLILAYFQSWNAWQGKRKQRHIRLGFALSLFSWITMALIVSILGFMMDPGQWEVGSSLLTAIFNPVYVPQLAFRTTLAMVQAGLFVWLLIPLLVRDLQFRERAVQFVARWVLAFTPLLLAAAVWYRNSVPAAMAENIAVAMGTQQGAAWYSLLLTLSLIAALIVFGFGLVGLVRPKAIPRWSFFVPFCLSLALMMQFERVREFVRKPYVIGEYMYANGLRVKDVAVLQRDGLLRHATYCSTREIVPENRIEAGRDVFRIACSRCHTVHGMNSLTAKFADLFGKKEWSPDVMMSFVENMHGARPYMPPFPGNSAELKALVAFLISERESSASVAGAQTVGVELPREWTKHQLVNQWIGVAESSTASTSDRQEALTILASLRTPEADQKLGEWLNQFNAGAWPADLGLDILAAVQQTNAELKARAEALLSELNSQEDPMLRFRLALEGGNASRGAGLLQSKACITCHRVEGSGASVGPDLSQVATRGNREYLLESIVAPKAKIAKGFEAVTIVRDDGTTAQGLVRKRTDSFVTIKPANGDEVTIPTSEIDEIVEGQTMMPLEIWKTMTLSELRDLVAYLATLR